MFPRWGNTYLEGDVFSGGKKHITRDMCFPGLETGACVSELGEHISLGIRVSQMF